MSKPEHSPRVKADSGSADMESESPGIPHPAIFLDRDGTLNVDVHRLACPGQLELIPGAAEGVRHLNQAGFLSIVVTNQSAVARGELTESKLDQIHDKLQSFLDRRGAHLNAIYYCPHHPDSGLPGDRAYLKINCDCRKPATGMIDRAVADFSIDVSNSWMVGDTTTDIQTARNAGIRSALVRTGYGGRDGRWRIRPDYEFFDLEQAATFIVDQHAPLLDQARTIVPACDPGSLVAIGGLARSGKSTWASILSEALAERDQKAVILPLDSWLRPAANWRAGHGVGRYNIEEISALVERLSGRTKRIELTLGYDDRSSSDRSMVELGVEPEDIVLIEGVPALAIPALVMACSFSFHVECPEGVRRHRFARDHALRGLSGSETALLYREQQADDHTIIQEFVAVADFRVAIGS